MARSQRWLFVSDPDSAATAEEGKGLVVRISQQIRRKREFMGVCKRHFQLPGYFGNNWDALNDSLQGLTQPAQITLVHDGLPFGPESRILRQQYIALLDSLTENEAEGPEWKVIFPTECEPEVQKLRQEWDT